MPTPRKISDGFPELGENLAILIGQLVESNKVISEALRGLSAESQLTARAVALLSQNVEAIQSTLDEIDHLVRDSSHPENVVIKLKDLGSRVCRITQDIEGMQQISAHIQAAMAGIDQTKARVTGAHTVVFYLVLGAAWFVTTAIALYGALGQWASARTGG